MIITKEKECRKIVTSNGESLYIIEPGYIINESSYFIWEYLKEGKKYEELISYVAAVFNKVSRKSIEDVLIPLLNQFTQRKLIEGWVIPSNYTSIPKCIGERELYNNYEFNIITEMIILPTMSCNLRCKHCYIDKKSYSMKSKVELARWKELIDYGYDHGLGSVIITGGEPFLYEELIELIRYISLKGLKLTILTNGTLLDDKHIDYLASCSNCSVQISLDGSNAESYGFLRGRYDIFQTVIRNIKKLRDKNVSTSVVMALNKVNIEDIYDYSLFELLNDIKIKSIGFNPDIIQLSENDRESKKSWLLSGEDILEFINFIGKFLENQKLTYDIAINLPPAFVPETSLRGIKKEKPRCRRGVNSFTILPNGDVYMCPDYSIMNCKNMCFGNVLNDTLENIMATFKKVRENRLQCYQYLQGVCSICTERIYCGGGCRAAAYAKYSNMNAPYSFCQYMYELGIFPKEKIEAGRSYIKID